MGVEKEVRDEQIEESRMSIREFTKSVTFLETLKTAFGAMLFAFCGGLVFFVLMGTPRFGYIFLSVASIYTAYLIAVWVGGIIIGLLGMLKLTVYAAERHEKREAAKQ